MKACVIGLGSIGKRHVEVLRTLGVETISVSGHLDVSDDNYRTFGECLANHPDISYVVIANETAKHLETLLAVRKLYIGLVLVEKPFTHDNYVPEIPSSDNVFVAYNLRFHPIIQKIKTIVANQQILSAHIYVGQHLSTWRPDTDYSSCYSASKVMGGGVLRDLSHELDYGMWLFGEPTQLHAISGQFSNLAITSDDFCSVMYTSTKTPIVSINMNYLDHITQREIIINTNELTIKADLVKNTLCINDMIESFQVDRNLTYITQHKTLLETKEYGDLCRLDTAKKIQQCITDIESQGHL